MVRASNSHEIVSQSCKFARSVYAWSPEWRGFNALRHSATSGPRSRLVDPILTQRRLMRQVRLQFALSLGNIVEAFFNQVLVPANGYVFLSHEHCTVDGTLLGARAGHNRFRPKDEIESEHERAQ